MRTTVDIPASLRQKLVNEAARRNEKGYSGIVAEALEIYFQERSATDRGHRLHDLRGSLDENEYREAVTVLHDGRGNWKI